MPENRVVLKLSCNSTILGKISISAVITPIYIYHLHVEMDYVFVLMKSLIFFSAIWRGQCKMIYQLNEIDKQGIKLRGTWMFAWVLGDDVTRIYLRKMIL
jgi:hypothetical protein